MNAFQWLSFHHLSYLQIMTFYFFLHGQIEQWKKEAKRKRMFTENQNEDTESQKG